MKIVFLILTIYIVSVYSKKRERCYPIDKAGLSNQECPVRPYMKTFDAEKIKGTWYTIEAYPSSYYSGMSCYVKNFVPTGQYTYNDTYCERFNGENKCTTFQIEHVDEDGKLYFVIPNRALDETAYYLDIVYDSYLILYVCVNLENGGSQTYLWIMSRTPSLNSDKLAEAYGKIKGHFDVKALQKIEQNDKTCNPRPGPGISDKPCPVRPHVDTFDVEKMEGRWYGIKSYPNVYFESMKCHIGDIVPSGDHIYNETYCEITKDEYKCRFTQLDHFNQDGEFNFVIDGRNVLESGSYFYVEYDSYYINYVCENFESGGSQTRLWIASRTPTLSDEKLAEAYRMMEGYFDVDALEKIVQDSKICDPRPGPGFSLESCPNRPYIQEFDVEKAAGDWYYVESYPNAYFETMNCHVFEFVPSGDNVYNTTFCDKPEANQDYNCKFTQLNHPYLDGEFNFVVEGQTFVDGGFYLHIDYDSYFILYICHNQKNGHSNSGVWIASRTKTLSADKLAEAHQKIERYFNVAALTKIEQSDDFCNPRPF